MWIRNIGVFEETAEQPLTDATTQPLAESSARRERDVEGLSGMVPLVRRDCRGELIDLMLDLAYIMERYYSPRR